MLAARQKPLMTGLRRAGGDGCSRASISENSRRICPRIPILTCFCHSARLAGRTWTLCTGPRSDLPRREPVMGDENAMMVCRRQEVQMYDQVVDQGADPQPFNEQCCTRPGMLLGSLWDAQHPSSAPV